MKPLVPSFSGLLVILLVCAGLDAGAETNSVAAKKNAQENALIRKQWEAWNAPVKPFRLVGNIYYVGAVGVSSFLITTPEGHILLLRQPVSHRAPTMHNPTSYVKRNLKQNALNTRRIPLLSFSRFLPRLC